MGTRCWALLLLFAGNPVVLFDKKPILSPPPIMVLGPPDNRQSNKSPQGRPTLDEHHYMGFRKLTGKGPQICSLAGIATDSNHCQM